ncbi:MAG: MBL fold metallo-hydrolase [Oscillospiraceae bacterium]|nr:MBL fold metallo-hydrolase [Oscillospiraceae bacterium]
MAKRNNKNSGNRTKRQSVTKNQAFISIIFIIVLFVFFYLARQNGLFGDNGGDLNINGQFVVHFIDVGQGDSELIQSPDGGFMLIDTGVSDEWNKLSAYLDNFKVKNFEYVIFTHPHSDHIGSADKIVKNYDIGTLIMPQATNNSKEFKNLTKAIEDKNLQITPPVPGTTYQFGGAEFTILAPQSEKYDNLNNYSVVVEMTYGENKFLFVGDIEKQAENEIINYCKENNFDISADVLKVPHHGSSTSSTQGFLDLVKPSIAVISCGLNNSYNHPNQKVVQRIEAMGTTVYRTDLDGDVVITSDGQNLSVKKGRDTAVSYSTDKTSGNVTETTEQGDREDEG